MVFDMNFELLSMLINENFLELLDFQNFCSDQYFFQKFFIPANLDRLG